MPNSDRGSRFYQDVRRYFEEGARPTSLPAGNGKDRFSYDPTVPVPSHGGGVCCTGGAVEPGSFDQRGNEARHDVLVYTTEPLGEDLEVTGPVELHLYFASSAADTDFTATLTDVHPDAAAIHVCEGIRGVTFRESMENPTPIEPGEIYFSARPAPRNYYRLGFSSIAAAKIPPGIDLLARLVREQIDC